MYHLCGCNYKYKVVKHMNVVTFLTPIPDHEHLKDDKSSPLSWVPHCDFFNPSYLQITPLTFCIICKIGRRGISPTRNGTHLLENVLNLFVCIKLNIFLTIFLSLSVLFHW